MQMILMSAAMGGDERTVSVMHSVRVMLTVIIIPFWFRFYYGYTGSATDAFGSILDLTFPDMGVLVACAVGGIILGRLLRLPIYFMLGPMIVAVLVHAFGLSTARPSGDLISLAQIAVGTGTGCRFIGTSIRTIGSVARIAVGTTVLMIALAALFALVLHELTGLPFEALLLAFSPGGVAEMNVITVTLGIGPLFVSAHHLLRLSLLMLAMPLLLKLFVGRLGRASKPAASD